MPWPLCSLATAFIMSTEEARDSGQRLFMLLQLLVSPTHELSRMAATGNASVRVRARALQLRDEASLGESAKQIANVSRSTGGRIRRPVFARP